MSGPKMGAGHLHGRDGRDPRGDPLTHDSSRAETSAAVRVSADGEQRGPGIITRRRESRGSGSAVT